MKYAVDITEVQPEGETKMPSTKDFLGAKISSGFNFVGEKFGKGARIVNLKKDLAIAEGKLNSTVAKDIGKFFITQILSGKEVVTIPDEMKTEVFEIQAEINRLKEELNHGS